MPRVESYGEPKVGVAPLPGARKQAHETFESQGGQVAVAQGQFGAVVARQGLNIYSEIKRNERDRADQVANLTTLRQFNDLEHQVLHAPETGLLTKSGLAPMEGRDAALEAFDLQAGEIAANLKTDAQRLFYEQQKITRRDSIRQRIDDYAGAQLRAHDDKETTATLASIVNTGIANATSPRAIAEQLQLLTTTVDRYAERTKMGPAAKADLDGKVRTQLHTGVIDRLLTLENDRGAQAYFDETKDQIDGAAIARIEKALEEGGLRGRAQRTSDQILNTASTLKDAMEQVRAIADPKERDEVQQRVEHHFTVKDREDREAHEKMFRGHVDILDRTRGDWTKIPVSEWQELTVSERASLKAYGENIAEGTTVKTDAGAYYFLTSLATSPDPILRKQFLQTNLLEYVDRLSIADRKQLIDLQGRIRQGDAEAADKMLVDVTAQNDMVDEALQSMGLVGTPTEIRENPQLAERANAFRRAVREAVGRVNARPDRVGKPATDDEVQSIVDQLRTPAGRRRTGWVSSAPSYAFEVPQAHVAKVQDIPAGERRRIEDAIRRRQLPVSEDLVIRLFNANLAQTRKDR